MRLWLGIWGCLFVCIALHGIEATSRQDDRGPRPQLINNRVVPLSATIANDYKEYLLTTLEFDQDVYVNEPLLCPGQDQDCTPSECVPCDWSGENPTGCDNVNCCGAAQWPQFPASNHTSDWCDSSLPPYTKLEFDEPSDRFTLSKGEYKYFRFFVGEEQYCRSIHVEVTTHFGDMSLSISNFVAYPDQSNLKQIENGQQFEASNIYRIDPGAQYGQSVLTLCPNANPGYERGTFSIAILGFRERNDATVTIYLGEDRYPILPPDDRIRCEDVPDDVYTEPAFTAPQYPWTTNFCLEEGVTEEVVIPRQQYWDVVLPIRPGCREISFAFNGFTNTETDPSALPDTQLFFTCGISTDLSAVGNEVSSLVLRYLKGYGTFYISACFEEVTYLHCTPLNLWDVGKTLFYWSSESKPIRHKVSEASPGMLTTYYGRNTAGALLRSLNYQGYLDWSFRGWSWLTQPTTDPLAFYPPYAEYSYNYSRDPLDDYLEAGFVETRSNIVNIVDLTYSFEEELRSREILLEEGFIFTMGITSATGMPVDLCNDDDFESGRCQRGSPLADINSWTDFLSTRTFSTMNIVEDVKCNGNSYNKQNDLVKRIVQEGLESSDFDTIAQKTFLTDLYNAGLTRTACIATMERALSTEVDNITKLDKKFCPYARSDPEWQQDPCCNFRQGVIGCCTPISLPVEEEEYIGDEPDTSELSCRNPACDDSFFADIATSLNAIGNPLTGCASGLQDPEYELRVLIEKSMADFIRPCLISSGYGDTFEGVECSSQEDCAFLDTTCDMTEGRCRMQSAQEARNNYFECFFDNMPPMVEDYIRMNVLSVVDNDYPKDSKYFKAVVREAATQYDCLGLNPFDLSYGERWAADAALYCKGEGLGFQDLGQMEAHEDEINEICPEFLCLGESTCRWEDAKRCKSPTDQLGCFDTYHKLIAASESSCPVDESVCSVTSTLSSSCEGDEYQCVICLSEWDSCTLVEGVDTEEECARLVACEVPGGGMRYDLTEEQCLNLGECSSLCDGQSCRSVDGLKGTCVVEGASDCESIGGSEFEGVCILETVKNTYACDQASLELSMTTQWYTCESMDIDECNDYVNFTAPYKHLRCFVDRFRSCDNEDECLATGTCSDIEVARNVVEDPVSGWFSVSYGTCLSSGYFGANELEEPECLVTIGEYQYTYGCYLRGFSEALCAFYAAPTSFLRGNFFTAWITPARNETECRQEVWGRFGCARPKNYEKTFYFWDREACECRQGYADYLYTWTDGSWKHGIAHPLTWTQKELRPKYTWENALSLVKMESWVRNAVEGAFVFALKSQLVCEGNYVSSSLTTLVCDCVEDGSDCYNTDIETEVGISLACADASSLLKGPSSFTTFSETSINDLCTESSLYLIQSSWFQFPRSPPSVSFQFAERKEKGVVVNRNGAEVGEVMGDGSHIVFQNPDRVKHFETCLLISKDEDLYANDYPRRDFGVPVDDFRSIQPLGLENVQERKEETSLYWCANITSNKWSGEGVALFPIVTTEDYDDKEEDFLSHRTESLLYTLAACYIFDLIIVFLFLIVVIQKSLSVGKSLPLIAYLGFFLAFVCIFRIVFCFVYIDDGFSELSEYVVFEIPTFLLFTGVIWVLILFMQLSKKNTFDFRSQDKGIWGVGFLVIFIVWSLFIIVTVVYSEVILEETDESVCPGRVQSDNEEIEDDTRTLSIVYQTIVIFLTLLFAIAFGKQSRKLFNMSKNSGTKAKVFIFRLGAIIVLSFLLRCILFIILLASDITSDIYLFITLFLTEVLMILLISLELNKGFYTQMAGVVVTTMGGSTFGGSRGSATKSSGSKTSKGSSGDSLNYSYSDEK